MKRIRFTIIMIATMVLGFVTIAIFRSREPRYQGRTLTQWLEAGEIASVQIYSRSSRGQTVEGTVAPAWQEASNAVRQMAPDTVPLLVKWFQAEDSAIKVKLADWLRQHPSMHFQIASAESRRGLAMVGFRLLGSEARPAWPALVKLTDAPDTKLRILALRSLYDSNADPEILLPVLLHLIHDPQFGLQVTAANLLHQRFPEEAEATDIYERFPNLKHISTERSITNQLQNK